MNDDELITAVREPFTAVHSATPVEQIVSRSRAIRARRRIPGVAAALAVAAGTALAVTALLPSGHQPSHACPACGLDGRQARPTAISGSPSTSCATRPGCSARSAPMASRSASPSPARRTRPASPTALAAVRASTVIFWSSMVTALPGHGNLRVLVIHPPAFPAGAGLAIAAGHPGQSPRGGGVELTIGPPVKASPQCTGS